MLGDLRKIDFDQILSKSFFIIENTEIFYKTKTCKFLSVYLLFALFFEEQFEIAIILTELDSVV